MNLAILLNNYAWPISMKVLAWRTYIIFAIWDCIQTIVIYYIFPETKNRTLEELDDIFSSSNPRKASTEKRRILVDVRRKERSEWVRGSEEYRERERERELARVATREREAREREMRESRERELERRRESQRPIISGGDGPSLRDGRDSTDGGPGPGVYHHDGERFEMF